MHHSLLDNRVGMEGHGRRGRKYKLVNEQKPAVNTIGVAEVTPEVNAAQRGTRAEPWGIERLQQTEEEDDSQKEWGDCKSVGWKLGDWYQWTHRTEKKIQERKCPMHLRHQVSCVVKCTRCVFTRLQPNQVAGERVLAEENSGPFVYNAAVSKTKKGLSVLVWEKFYVLGEGEKGTRGKRGRRWHIALRLQALLCSEM